MDKETIYGKVKVVVKNGEYGVTDLDDNVIVPFGKYDWIEGFDFGLSRVRTKGIHNHPESWVPYNCTSQKEYNEQMAEIKEEGRKYEEDRRQHNERYSKWGIINEKGEEVLPVEYDEVWGFMGRGYASTNVEKDGLTRRVYFSDLISSEAEEKAEEDNNGSYCDDYREYYEEPYDWKADTWDALTDGMYGDMPEGWDGDWDFIGR